MTDRALVNRTVNDTYRIICPDCGNHTELRHDQLPRSRRKFKVTCDCGGVTRIVCERRRDARKAVQFNGYLFALGTKDQQADIALVELSISGIGFTTQLPNLEVGQQFSVGFFLDDASITWIEQDIEIRNIKESGLVGAEFTDPEHYSVDLEFYLMTISLTD